MSVIWVPDGEPFEVEWYTSEGKAVGVQRISEHFMAHPVEPKRETGFRPPRDHGSAYFHPCYPKQAVRTPGPDPS